jgi:ankyrin repeat protein
MFGDCLDLDDINSLVRTSRALHRVLTPYMYWRAKDLKSKYGRPYFLRAVDAGNLAAVTQFIEVGTLVNMTDTSDPSLPTSLHSCVHCGNMAIAQLLIQNGVNRSAVNQLGWTPLHYAVGRGWPASEAMASLLLDAGTDISTSAPFFDTILYTATRYGTSSIVQLLLQRGAIPTTCEPDGATLLHYAASHATAATVRHFLEAGLNIDATNGLGETPLHCAAIFDRKDTIEALLQWGANVHAFDNAGFTPLQVYFQWKPSDSAAHRILHHLSLPGVCSWIGSETCVPVCRFAEFDEPVVDLLLSAGANISLSRNSTLSALAQATSWVHSQYGIEAVDCW